MGQRPMKNNSNINSNGNNSVKMLDVVALTEDVPASKLSRGQVGTVVEAMAPGVFEVEFSDDEGRTYALAALRAEQLIVLHYEPVASR